MPMLLKGDDGAEFELALIEDRFPEIQDDSGDSGYLTLSFRVATTDESWEETAPCLNLYEVKNLADWLEALGRGEPEVSEVELLEPELRFSVARAGDSRATIRIGFHLEGRPEEFALDAPTEEAEWVDIRTSREQILTAAGELRENIEAVSPARRPREEGDGGFGIQGVPDENLNLISDENLTPDDLTDEDRRR